MTRRSTIAAYLVLFTLLIASVAGVSSRHVDAATPSPTPSAVNNATAVPTVDFSVDPLTPQATSEAVATSQAASGSGVITAPDGSTIQFGNLPPVNPPPTLDDLIKLYPDLKPYLDSIAGKNFDDMDLSDLYARIVKIYTEQGADGLGVFLKDSGILDKLGIPLSYVDLLTAFGDKGDIQAVEKLARDRKIITAKDEIAGYLTLDSRSDLDQATKDLTALGVSVYAYLDNTDEVEIGIPLAILQQFQTPGALLGYLAKVAHVTGVTGFRPPTPPTLSSVNWKPFVAQGPKTIGADKWQAAGITGKGIKIGILDMGFGTILSHVGKELPAADQITSNIPLDTLNSDDEDHGTACSMIVHAAAPDAQLFIAEFDPASEGSWTDAVNFLKDAGVQIISYSIGSSVGPRDGTYGDAPLVNSFVADTGILWVASAGNEATDHTSFTYKDNGKGLEDFGSDTTSIPFVAFEPETSVIMDWNGNWKGGEKDEYDFKIVDKNGKEVATAAEPRKGGKNDYPYQLTVFEPQAKQVYFLLIHKAKAKGNANIDIFIPNAVFPDWAQIPDHSVVTPGDATGVLTVGATGLTDDTLEDYSSQGPTTDDRVKPDVTAPTGEVMPGFEDGFFGTSGSAPLVAGAAGLVLQKFPDLSGEELKAYMMKNVVDLGDPGADPKFGAGRVALPDPGKVKPNDPTSNEGDAPGPDRSNSNGPTATITALSSTFNTKQKGAAGLSISVSFKVSGLKGKQGVVAILFFDGSNQQIPTNDPNYQVGSGLGAGKLFVPKYDDATFDNLAVFIPNSALSGLAKAKNPYFIVAVADPNNLDNPLAVSNKTPVKITKK